MKKTTIFLFVLIVLINTVSALTEYPEVGTDGYSLGISLWNEERSSDCNSGEILCTTRNIGSPNFMPFISDLDNDGTNEIIVIDGSNVRLYQNRTLDILDAFLLSGSPEKIIMFDIDDDNFTEIIVYRTDNIEIVEYNGTAMFQQTSFSIMPSREQVANLKCRGVNDCIAVAVEETPAPDTLYATGFNSTDVSTPEKEITGLSVGLTLCPNLNRMGNMEVADVDNDGSDDYIFTIGEVVSFSNGQVHIIWLSKNDTEVIIDNIATRTLHIPSSSDCGVLGDFTPPLVFDIDGSISNGLETVIGIMISADDFKMFSYTSAGGDLDDYPEVTNGEGRLISNVFRGNFFTDTGSEDFCVFGYENEAELLNMVCASEQTGEVPETNDFDFDTTGFTFNVSDNYNLVTHSTQQDNILTDGNNLDEVINSYGVFRLDFLLINELELIWENPKGDSVLYNVDIEKINLDDLILLTNTNLWYIDDLFVNTNAVVSRYTTNPSIRSVIQLNESVSMNVFCTDIDGDLVTAGITAYESSPNRQNFNSSLGASGTAFPLSFVANQTIANGRLIIYCRDNQHNDTIEIETTFSVALNGAVFGDSFFDSGDLIAEEVINVTGEGGTNQSATDNSVRDGIISFSNSIGVTPFLLLMLFLMLGDILIISILSLTADLLKASLIIALVLDLFGIILFSYLRLISATRIIGMVFILILITSLWIFSKVTSGGGDNG